MKKCRFLVLGVIALFAMNVSAQKHIVDAKASKITWLGEKIGGEHKGTIVLKSGEFTEKGNKIVSGNFVMDMTSIKDTDLDDEGYRTKLEGHLKSDDFFGVEKHPTANLIITSSEPFKGGKAKVKGDLTIKGKTNPIEFEVVRSGKSYKGKLVVDRSKYDVRYGSKSFFDNLGDKVIYDEFNIYVDLSVK